MTNENSEIESATVAGPSDVCIVVPSHDGNVCSGFAGGLASSGGKYGALSFVLGMSNVALARNMQAAIFLSTNKPWLLCIDADIQFSPTDVDLLFEGDELVRCAEYSKKDFTSKTPAQFGLGFCLLHRSVFERIQNLKSDDGKPMVGQFFWDGKLVDDFFPTGPNMGGHWFGEDHGFFHLVRLAGIKPRAETRTKLIHWGRHGYTYSPQIGLNTSLPEAK